MNWPKLHAAGFEQAVGQRRLSGSRRGRARRWRRLAGRSSRSRRRLIASRSSLRRLARVGGARDGARDRHQQPQPIGAQAGLQGRCQVAALRAHTRGQDPQVRAPWRARRASASGWVAPTTRPRLPLVFQVLRQQGDLSRRGVAAPGCPGRESADPAGRRSRGWRSCTAGRRRAPGLPGRARASRGPGRG